jgi:hypothetical protein
MRILNLRTLRLATGSWPAWYLSSHPGLRMPEPSLRIPAADVHLAWTSGTAPIDDIAVSFQRPWLYLLRSVDVRYARIQ